MKEKIYAALFALFLFGTANASTILWNVFEHSNFHGYESFHYYGEQTPEISFSVSKSGLSSWTLLADGPINLGDSRALWVVANIDDILTQQYFVNAPVVLDAWYSDSSSADAGLPIEMGDGEDLYLAMKGNYYKKVFNDDIGADEFIYSPYTAWVSITMHGGALSLTGSAIYYNYGLQVGGGPMPTPEPSSLHLLLVGLACVLLRRCGIRRLRRMGDSPHRVAWCFCGFAAVLGAWWMVLGAWCLVHGAI